jgi:hypothetical protein
MPLKLSDPGKEEAICGAIASMNFELIDEAILVKPEAFTVPWCRIIYTAALDFREPTSAYACCAESINDWIKSHQLVQEFTNSYGPASFGSWTKWSDQIDRSATIIQDNLASSNRLLGFYFEELKFCQHNRETKALGERIADGSVTGQDGAYELLGITGHSDKKPKCMSMARFVSEPPVTPSVLINGLLYQGGKLTIGGSSKSYKTWMLLQLALCVSHGLPWIGFETIKSNVLYLNFELQDHSMHKRIVRTAQALGMPVPDNSDILNLRGRSSKASQMIKEVALSSRQKEYALIIIDPVYKLLGELDENSARDITRLMNEVESLSLESGAAVAFGSHFSKGNQAAKESMDRISGSGVFGRDPDAILTLTSHQERDCFSVDCTLRDFPRQDSFVVRWDCPLMIKEEALDPEELKTPKGEKPKVRVPTSDILEFMSATKAKSAKDLVRAFVDKYNTSERTFWNKWEKLKESTLIYETEEGWLKV